MEQVMHFFKTKVSVALLAPIEKKTLNLMAKMTMPGLRQMISTSFFPFSVWTISLVEYLDGQILCNYNVIN